MSGLTEFRITVSERLGDYEDPKTRHGPGVSADSEESVDYRDGVPFLMLDLSAVTSTRTDLLIGSCTDYHFRVSLWCESMVLCG